ncbi:hypothetical protein D3C84_1153830 [compost metagenome]
MTSIDGLQVIYGLNNPLASERTMAVAMEANAIAPLLLSQVPKTTVTVTMNASHRLYTAKPCKRFRTSILPKSSIV